jgi:hypothetical protein
MFDDCACCGRRIVHLDGRLTPDGVASVLAAFLRDLPDPATFLLERMAGEHITPVIHRQQQTDYVYSRTARMVTESGRVASLVRLALYTKAIPRKVSRRIRDGEPAGPVLRDLGMARVNREAVVINDGIFAVSSRAWLVLNEGKGSFAGVASELIPVSFCSTVAERNGT